MLLHGERENAGLNIVCASRVFLLESVVNHAFEVQGTWIIWPVFSVTEESFSYRPYRSLVPNAVNSRWVYLALCHSVAYPLTSAV
jgi:hypothetical protein